MEETNSIMMQTLQSNKTYTCNLNTKTLIMITLDQGRAGNSLKLRHIKCIKHINSTIFIKLIKSFSLFQCINLPNMRVMQSQPNPFPPGQTLAKLIVDNSELELKEILNMFCPWPHASLRRALNATQEIKISKANQIMFRNEYNFRIQ